MDTLTKERRSWNMSRIKGRDTGPERIVRSILHRMGYRFVLHRKDLPGKPDIVMPKYKTTIFVHGCFWHRHKGCADANLPKTRPEFWGKKLDGNAARDKVKQQALRDLGWQVIVLWECEIQNTGELRERMKDLISASAPKLRMDSLQSR